MRRRQHHPRGQSLADQELSEKVSACMQNDTRSKLAD